MVNLLSTLIALSLYNSGYFWPTFFVSNAVCRFQFNRVKTLLWISVGSIIAIPFLALTGIKFLPEFAFISQAIICGFSFAWNVYKKNWKKNYLFFYVEPILAIIFLQYFNLSTILMKNLYNWLFVYLLIQSISSLWNILGLKIELRENEIDLGITANSSLNNLFDKTWINFQQQLAKLTGLDTEKVEFLRTKFKSTKCKQDDNGRKYLNNIHNYPE